MQLRNLITFMHVAELGSFTKAAEQLGYMHSAAPNGSWCGDQRQLSAANGTLN